MTVAFTVEGTPAPKGSKGGYQDGRMAERARANGERQRERDRAREEETE